MYVKVVDKAAKKVITKFPEERGKLKINTPVIEEIPDYTAVPEFTPAPETEAEKQEYKMEIEA